MGQTSEGVRGCPVSPPPFSTNFFQSDINKILDLSPKMAEVLVLYMCPSPFGSPRSANADIPTLSIMHIIQRWGRQWDTDNFALITIIGQILYDTPYIKIRGYYSTWPIIVITCRSKITGSCEP
jgi:hypothetical protein